MLFGSRNKTARPLVNEVVVNEVRPVGPSPAELAELYAVKERSDLLDRCCGVGFWQAILHNADAFDPKSAWTWSPEFRRLIG
jgi:hypothetical protein